MNESRNMVRLECRNPKCRFKPMHALGPFVVGEHYENGELHGLKAVYTAEQKIRWRKRIDPRYRRVS